MLTQIIWWGAVSLELTLLLRGLQGRLFFRFPAFYFYISFVFAKDLLLFYLYRRAPQQYALTYWICQFVALILGCVVLFEIYRIALRSYPGTARVARNLLFLIFALTFAKVLVNHSLGATTTAELERNLRVVQAFGVLAIICVMLAYSIPSGRHLKGILAGYALFVANSIIQLSVLSYLGPSFHRMFVYLLPFSYLVVLCIWVAALWSSASESVHSPSPLEIAAADHPSLVSQTERELQNIQLGLPGAVRR